MAIPTQVQSASPSSTNHTMGFINNDSAVLICVDFIAYFGQLSGIGSNADPFSLGIFRNIA